MACKFEGCNCEKNMIVPTSEEIFSFEFSHSNWKVVDGKFKENFVALVLQHRYNEKAFIYTHDLEKDDYYTSEVYHHNDITVKHYGGFQLNKFWGVVFETAPVK